MQWLLWGALTRSRTSRISPDPCMGRVQVVMRSFALRTRFIPDELLGLFESTTWPNIDAKTPEPRRTDRCRGSYVEYVALGSNLHHWAASQHKHSDRGPRWPGGARHLPQRSPRGPPQLLGITVRKITPEGQLTPLVALVNLGSETDARASASVPIPPAGDASGERLPGAGGELCVSWAR